MKRQCLLRYLVGAVFMVIGVLVILGGCDLLNARLLDFLAWAVKPVVFIVFGAVFVGIGILYILAAGDIKRN